jgi:hypothetical protein
MLSPGLVPQFVARREFLRAGGGLAAAAWSLPAWSADPGRAANEDPAKSCILIYLLGGPPHLDMFDLKPEAPAEVRGPFSPVPTSVPGLQICEHLPRLAGIADRFALIRSVSHRNSNHTPMIYYTLTGRETAFPEMDNDVRPPQRSDFPHMGSIISHVKGAPGALPGFVAIPEVAVRSSLSGEYKRARTPLRGGGAGFLGTQFEALCVNGEPGTPGAVPDLNPPDGVAEEHVERRAELLSVLEQRGPAGRAATNYRAVREHALLLTGSSQGGRELFSLESEPSEVRQRYGEHRFGKALLLARRLAEAGVPMTAVHFNEMTVCDGWDTHKQNFAALQTELLPMLDQGMSALLEDLDQRGRLSETLVVCLGEFGRTPKINNDAGRDHWGPCSSALLAGGGIQGGRVLGASDGIGAYPVSDPVDPVDIHATMYHCLGLDPQQHVYDPERRPGPISTGQVIRALL